MGVPHADRENTAAGSVGSAGMGKLGSREVVESRTESGGAQDTWAMWLGVVTAVYSGLKLFPSEQEKRSRNFGFI